MEAALHFLQQSSGQLSRPRRPADLSVCNSRRLRASTLGIGGDREASRGLSHALELLGDLLERVVDVELWTLAEALLAQRTEAGFAPAVPVRRDAGQAEAVATWCGDGVGEDVQANRAGELLLRQEVHGDGHGMDGHQLQK